MTKLSDTQRVILSQATQREDRLALPPQRLPAAARQTVAKSLIKQGLVSDEQADAYNARHAWQIDGRTRLLRITDAGLRAIGVEPAGQEPDDNQAAPPQPTAPTEAALLPAAGQGESQAAFSAAPPSTSEETAKAPERAPVRRHSGNGHGAALRMAATSVVAAWGVPEREGLDDAVTALRAALAAPPRAQRDDCTSRQPRSGTKQEAVLALLRRNEGATIAQVIDATGWQQHTVRGFLAGLKRKGITVEVLERVRQVGPDKQGAKGSYSIYRIAG